MKYSKQQIREIFSGLWKKILARQKQGNIQRHNIPNHEPSTHEPEQMSNKQMNLFDKSGRKAASKPKKPISRPRQLTLPLRTTKKASLLKTYNDVDSWKKENFKDGVYVGPDLSKITDTWMPGVTVFKFEPGTEMDEKFQEALMIAPDVILKYYNDNVKKQVQLDREMKKHKNLSVNEVTSIIQEIIEEELSEINYTTDSSGKSIIAQGAPGSVIRFVTEHPDIIKQMRDWIKDCQWADLPDEAAVDELSDEEVLRGIQNNYDGGIKDFLRGSNSQAQVPVGYKESLKENWSGSQEDEVPDGFSNDAQRAFAHSQTTTPRGNDTEKAKQLAKSGKYVVLVEVPIFCKSTDACLGTDISIHHVAATRDEAAEEAQKIYKDGHGDYNVSVIGPEDVTPKKPEPTTPEDDVPFQESIRTGKFSNNIEREIDQAYEMMALARQDGDKADEKRWFEKIKQLKGEVDVKPSSNEGVGYVYDKDMKKDPKHIPGERWRVKFEEGVSKSELKGVIKELINEMWYGSKNDVEGDETHDESLNEIFDSYGELETFVKQLPPEEINKITAISKEMGLGAFDSILEYLRRIEKEKKGVKEVAPPGFEGTVRAMKKHKEIDNPWALAWSMKNKGYKSHK